MKIKFLIYTAFLLLSFISCSESQSDKAVNDSNKTNDTIVWVIENRSVPVPAAASEIIRNSISSMPQPEYNSQQFVPKDNSEWMALQKSADEAKSLRMDKMVKERNVTVEQKVLNGIPVYYIKPSKVSDAFSNAIYFNLHGGAYVLNAGKSGIDEGIIDAAFLNMTTIAVDYRMPPEHPYPTALDDAIAAYKGILELYPTHKIVIGGASAGAGLTMATVLKMKELKLRLPDAVFLGTPWADLTKTGDSYYINGGIDRTLTNYGLLEAAAKLYANGRDLKDPYLSPIYGDLSGFPPTFLVTGTRDLFLSNTVRTHRKLRDAGVEADLHVIEGMSHADFVFLPDAPESISIYKDLSNFLKKHF